MELPHGLIEDILEKLPVKSLLKFKSVSTQWKSTIESPYFKKKQLLYSQPEDPNILIISLYEGEDNEHVTRMLKIGSSDLIKLPACIPIPLEKNKALLCYTYSVCGKAALIRVMNQIGTWTGDNDGILCKLGFGKDKFRGRYKLVWSYNSFGLSLSNATVCEVFDFNTNTWKYVTASPVRIFDEQTPVHIDGSLYWFTDEYFTETKILS
ncbi:hypothetical protein N665_0979s0006 [Sinapis alba]|nr:hypothetical protein N665_0979s0006 [Sinapis alba]